MHPLRAQVRRGLCWAPFPFVTLCLPCFLLCGLMVQEEVAGMTALPHPLTRITVSHDGRLIATSGPGHEGVLVWHRQPGVGSEGVFCSLALTVLDYEGAEPASVVSLQWMPAPHTVAFSPSVLMALTSDGQLRVWREVAPYVSPIPDTAALLHGNPCVCIHRAKLVHATMYLPMCVCVCVVSCVGTVCLA
jgi:hypothetical protein